jgi:hypothetical protein
LLFTCDFIHWNPSAYFCCKRWKAQSIAVRDCKQIDLSPFPISCTCQGEILDGKQHGKEKITFSDGEVFEGILSIGSPSLAKQM